MLGANRLGNLSDRGSFGEVAGLDRRDRHRVQVPDPLQRLGRAEGDEDGLVLFGIAGPDHARNREGACTDRDLLALGVEAFTEQLGGRAAAQHRDIGAESLG